MSGSQHQKDLQENFDKTFSWQVKLLPFMQFMLGGLTLIFLCSSLWQFNKIQNQNEKIPELDLTTAFSGLKDEELSESDRVVYVQWKTLALLEKNTLDRRYHQANTLLMTRTWTRYLGFLTGMILALVGAAFVLGKLREESSDFSAKNAGAEFSLKSTSPGLILGFLGTILMAITIFIHNEIVVDDAPVYTNFYFTPNSNKKPEPLESSENQSDEDPISTRNKNN